MKKKETYFSWSFSADESALNSLEYYQNTLERLKKIIDEAEVSKDNIVEKVKNAESNKSQTSNN